MNTLVDDDDPYRCAERVAAGAAWLDTRRPDWWRLLDLASFDLNDCRRCVLGQLYGDYANAPLVTERLMSFSAAAYDMGFTGGGEENIEWADLAQCWRELVVARRLAPVAAP